MTRYRRRDGSARHVARHGNGTPVSGCRLPVVFIAGPNGGGVRRQIQGRRGNAPGAGVAPFAASFSAVLHRCAAHSIRYIVSCLVVGLVAAGLGGCKSSPARFYTLSPDATLATLATPHAIPLAVGPVTVPDLVDRPQIVTRAAGNEVAINEFARWAQPLKGNIARVVAADLGTLLNSQQVTVFAGTTDPLATWYVRLDVMRFDAEPGQDVIVDVQWTIRAPGKQPVRSGRSIVREAVSGAGFEAMTTAYDRALAVVSRDIAAAVGTMIQP